MIARGVGLGIAQEAALKCKETCGLHAESFSSAEVRHGPQALLQRRASRRCSSRRTTRRARAWRTLARDLMRARRRGGDRGARGATARSCCRRSPRIRRSQPLLLVQSFYRLANAVAVARGLDPDRPPHLQKVTETL